MNECLSDSKEILHKQLKKFQAELIHFFIEIGKIKWSSKKLSEISGYLYLHGPLTQKQLEQLTGLARSTVSVKLNSLMGYGLNKRLVPGTHTFEYYFSCEFEKMVIEALTQRVKEMNEAISVSNRLIKELESLEVESHIQKNRQFIVNRLHQFITLIETYKKLSLKSNKSASNSIPSVFQKKDSLLKLDFQIPSLQQIERKFIEFLTNWSFLKRETGPSPMLLGYFITREELTQQDLQKLTNYSVSKLYKELKILLDLHLIKKDESRRPKVYYSIKRVDLSILTYMINNATKILQWKPKLIEINSKIMKNRNKWKQLQGFTEIDSWIKRLIKLTSLYKHSLRMLERVKKNLLNKIDASMSMEKK